MFKRKKIIFIAGIFSMHVAMLFGYLVFFKKRTLNIENNVPISEIMAEENNQQEAQPQENVDQQSAENVAAKNQDAPKETETKQDAPVKIVEKPVEKKVTAPVEQEETKDNAGDIKDKFISWGFTKADGRKIDTIIVHSSYDSLGDDPYSVDGIIKIYKQYDVSAHYLIARDGTAYHLVADKNIAWHAGVSKVPDGRTNVNDFSIGIEMVNTKDGKYTSAQYDALNSLIKSIKKQNSIKYILGHDDIAPGRKTDPWGIDWGKVNNSN